MKYPVSLLAACGLLCWTASLDSTGIAPKQSATEAGRSPVIVELFTSEGCSSCPAAAEFLGKLVAAQPIAGAEIIGLEEHVDYWNHDGWTDPYSSGDWTTRQQEYVMRLKLNTPYTPQVIVDGQTESSANDVRRTQEMIQQAAKARKSSLSFSAAASAKRDTLVYEVGATNIQGTGDGEKTDVWLAVTEAGLHTRVNAGENRGRAWEHASIVRSLRKIGSISSRSLPFLVKPEVKLQPDWKKENLRMVAFVQERKSGRIIGAALARVAPQ